MKIEKFKEFLIRFILNDPEYTFPKTSGETAFSAKTNSNVNSDSKEADANDQYNTENQNPNEKRYKLRRNLGIINVIIFALYICNGYLVHQNKERVQEYSAYYSEINLTEKSTESVFPIDINTATVEELTMLPEIGTKKAKLIVEYRTENGGFTNVEELKNISGIGEGTFNSIKDLVIIE